VKSPRQVINEKIALLTEADFAIDRDDALELRNALEWLADVFDAQASDFKTMAREVRILRQELRAFKRANPPREGGCGG